MKKYRLPDSDEWDRIVDEAFSSDEIHTFSEKYNLKKYQDYPIRKGITMKRNNLLMNITVVATALAVVAVPAGVYIAGNMTSTKSQTQFTEQSENEPASPVAEKENDKIYNVEYGWLPESFNRNDDTSYSYFTDADNKKIFMIASFVKNLTGEKTENGVALTVRDEYQTGNKTIDIRYNDDYVENSTDKDTTNYGRVATIYFNDTPYELELLVTDDVTKDDFAKIIENIRLVESDTETAEIHQGEQVAETENDIICDIEYGWLPDGLERAEGETYTHNFKNVNNDRKTISVNFNKNLTGEEIETDSSAPIRDRYENEDKTITVGYYDNYIENSTDTQHNVYGRQASVCFKDSPYQLIVWVTDDVTKDDFRKFLENIKLVPTDTEKAWVTYPKQVTKTEMTITDGNDDGQINEGIHQFTENDIDYDTIYNVEYGWLPEGLEKESTYGGKFYNRITGDGMTPNFSKVQKGAEYYEDTGNPEIEVTKEEWVLDGKTVSMYHRSNYTPDNPELNYGRIAFIYFDNTPYVLKLYVTDGISEEDFGKIIENVKLVSSKEETAHIYTGEDTDMLQEYRSGSTENTDDKIYALEYNWLPEGLEYNESGPYGGKFHSSTKNSGMTPSFVKNISGKEIKNERGFTVLDEYSTDDKDIKISYRDDYVENADNHNFGRIAIVYFKNTPYQLSLWVTDDITKDDLKKIIANVKLVASDTETAYIYEGESVEEKPELNIGSYENMGIPVEKSDIVQIGEEVHEKDPDVWGDISAKITSVSFGDDFNGLTTDGIGNPADYSQYLHTDGKLIENVREFYTTKNGKEETIYFDDTTVSVMMVTITYTNNGTTPTGDYGYCVCPTLRTQYDGYFFTPHIYNIMEAEAMLDEKMVGYTDNFRHLTADDMHFSFSSPNQKGKNEIYLDAGESTEVTLAFIVEDKFRDNLYLSMNDNGFVDLSNLE